MSEINKVKKKIEEGKKPVAKKPIPYTVLLEQMKANQKQMNDLGNKRNDLIQQLQVIERQLIESNSQLNLLRILMNPKVVKKDGKK